MAEYRRLVLLWSITVVISISAWLVFEIRSGSLAWSVPIARPVARAFYLAAAALTIVTPILTVRTVPPDVFRRLMLGAVGQLSQARIAIRSVLIQAWSRGAEYAPQLAGAAVLILATTVAIVSVRSSIDDGVEIMRGLPSALAAIGLACAAGAAAATPARGFERAVKVFALLALALLAWSRGGERQWPALMPAVTIGALCLLIGGFVQRRCARVDPRASTMLVVGAACVASVALAPVMLHWNISGWMDSHSYDVAAINIATGKVLSARTFYMPLYQYGMGLIYWAVGHVFFAQQIANVVFAVIGVAAMGYAARILFHSHAAAAVASLALIYSVELYQYAHLTQIENWYIPIVCLVLVAWARYWVDPKPATLLWMACALSAGMNTRNQGALFFGVVCLAPVAVRSLPLRARLAHVGVCAAIIAVSLVPWAYRNYVIEGRFSPAASRSSLYVGVLNDHRLGLYGIRYWDGWDAVEREYISTYPDLAQRERASLQASWSALVQDPAWTARAVGYRSLAYYGLLPSGMLHLPDLVPTDWSTEWPSYLYWRLSAIVLLTVSALALVTRYSAVQALLGAAVLANLSIVLFSGIPEARLGYPSWPLHALMAAGLFARKTHHGAVVPDARLLSWRIPAVALAVVAITASAAHATIGVRNLQRPLLESQVRINADVRLSEAALPLSGAEQPGALVRVRCMLSNYMYPPKISASAPGMPAFAADPQREMYFYAYLLSEDMRSIEGVIGATFEGAEASEPLVEGRAADLEGMIVANLHVPEGQFYARQWLRVTKARPLPIPAASLPAYP